MKIQLEGRTFNLDALDLENDELCKDWNYPEGNFLRKLPHHGGLVDQMIDWCFANLELLEILEPPSGPPGEGTKFFKTELDRCKRFGQERGAEYFVQFLLSRYPKAFMPSVKAVLEKTNGC